jgi:hypothetical protein
MEEDISLSISSSISIPSLQTYTMNLAYAKLKGGAALHELLFAGFSPVNLPATLSLIV